jgi:hypothetical protein
MGESDYEVLEETRRTAVQSAANLLETVDHAKRLRKKLFSSLSLGDDKGGDTTERSDFLFDVLRLNARYLNRLADIGKRHSHIPHQALERLYSVITNSIAPRPAERAGGEELLFTRQRLGGSFEIYNDVDRQKERTRVEWTALTPSLPDLDPQTNWIEYIGGQAASKKAEVKVPSPYRRVQVIRVRVTAAFLAQPPTNQKYTAEIFVHDGRAAPRRISVVIDWQADGGRGQ